VVISQLFPADWIVPDLKSRTKEELFKEITQLVVSRRPDISRETLLDALWERERQMTTGIAWGVALPHTNLPQLGATLGLLGLSRKGIEYNSLDGEPVHVVFFLLGDSEAPDEHIFVLRNLAMMLTNPDFFPTLVKCRAAKDVWATLRLFEQS